MSRLTFHLIPHTHWDREWYLPRGRFGTRLVAVLDDLIELLQGEPRVPGFLLDGQTVLLEDYLSVRPDRREAVRRLVAQGRIETGPWYVLADEQVPSGESLIRNLQLGTADSAALGARPGPLYSPDAFGHPAILPAIAAEFGLVAGVAWRGIAGGRDLFHWLSPDGRTVLMYHLPPEGYEIGSALSSRPEEARGTWEPVRKALVGRAASSHIAVFVGADHHAARNDLPALRDAIAALEPEHEVRLSRLADFLAAAGQTGGLATLAGELRQHGYTWALQGVHGTRAHQKRRNSRLELWLERYVEPLSALSRMMKGRDPRPRLDWAWRTLVQTHFHDAIGGCAGDAVARAVEVRQAEVEGIAREMARESLASLSHWDSDRARDEPGEVIPSLLVWNPAPRPRDGIVLGTITQFRRDVLVGPPGNRVPREGEPMPRFALRAASGEIIPVQVIGSGPALERLDASRHYPDLDLVERTRVAFESPSVGGLSSAVFTLVPGGEIPAWGGAGVSGRTLTNEHLAIEIEGDGSLTVIDKATGIRRERFLALESESDQGDTYTVRPASPPRVSRLTGPVTVAAVAGGPMVAAVEVTGSLTTASGTIDARFFVMLLRDDPVVRCTLRLENRAMDQRLRLRFSPGASSLRAIAGGQLGADARPIVRERPHVIETPVATAPAHRFVGLPGERGMALFAPGFFEYELEPEGDLLFTVLRAVGQLSRSDLPTRPGHAGWPTATPLAQCQGPDSLDVAFAVGNGWDDPVALFAAWENLFLPLTPRWIRDWNGEDTPFPGIELEGDGLALSAVVPARSGGGIVVRCYNLRTEPVEGLLQCGIPVKRAHRVRADETILEEIPLDAGAVRFQAGPRAIVSLLLSA